MASRILLIRHAETEAAGRNLFVGSTNVEASQLLTDSRQLLTESWQLSVISFQFRVRLRLTVKNGIRFMV